MTNPSNVSSDVGDSISATAETDTTAPGGAEAKQRRLRHWFGLLFRPLTAYPKVTIEAILTVASLVVGLIILPTLATPAAGATAIQAIVLERPANIPAYLFYGDFGSSSNTIYVGMDVPHGTTAKWNLFILYNSLDRLTNEQMSKPVNIVTKLSSSDLGERGVRGLELSGTTVGGSTSYSQLQNGYYTLVSQNANSFFSNSTGGGIPDDLEGFSFGLSGPVQASTVSGANVSVTLPSLLNKDDGSRAKEIPAPVNTEAIYDGGNYQAITGGATIEGGHYWDWYNHGYFPSTVATGLDTVEQQNEQNKTFIAAAMFGLSAAAVAALAIELVEVLEHRRARRRRAPEGASAAPSHSD
jgi:hypothetical protein